MCRGEGCGGTGESCELVLVTLPLSSLQLLFHRPRAVPLCQTHTLDHGGGCERCAGQSIIRDITGRSFSGLCIGHFAAECYI